MKFIDVADLDLSYIASSQIWATVVSRDIQEQKYLGGARNFLTGVDASVEGAIMLPGLYIYQKAPIV